MRVTRNAAFLARHSAWCAALVSLIWVLAGCEEQVVPEPMLRPVRYTVVQNSTGVRARSFAGTVRADTEAKLSFRVSGTIQSRPIQVGQRVAPGELIAELDPTDLELQVEQARAAVGAAEAGKRNAAANYERVQGLYENNNTSKSQLDAARAQAESAQQEVTANKQQLALAQRQLGYAKLIAPQAGSIASIGVDVNENVLAGQTIATLTSGDSLEVEVAMPESLVGQLASGDPVTVRLDAFGDREFAGSVKEVGVAATGALSTYPVSIGLEGDAVSVLPGMAAEVTFRFAGDREASLVVPATAVGEDESGNFVYLVEPDPAGDGFGIVHRIDIAVGELTVDGIQVLDGLEEGQSVVTAGVARIVDGQRVKIHESAGLLK